MSCLVTVATPVCHLDPRIAGTPRVTGETDPGRPPEVMSGSVESDLSTSWLWDP